MAAWGLHKCTSRMIGITQTPINGGRIGRRKSDKIQFRLFLLSLAMSGSLAVLASVIGYKAIIALDTFRDALERVAMVHSLKSL